MKNKDIVKLTNTYLAGEQLVYQKLIEPVIFEKPEDNNVRKLKRTSEQD